MTTAILHISECSSPCSGVLPGTADVIVQFAARSGGGAPCIDWESLIFTLKGQAGNLTGCSLQYVCSALIPCTCIIPVTLLLMYLLFSAQDNIFIPWNRKIYSEDRVCLLLPNVLLNDVGRVDNFRDASEF